MAIADAPFYILTGSEIRSLISLAESWGSGDRMPNAFKAAYDQALSRPLDKLDAAHVEGGETIALAIVNPTTGRRDFYSRDGKRV